MCTRYPIINKVSELKVHIELTRFVQPEKIEIDANERAVNEKSQYCFFVCTTFDSFLNDLENYQGLELGKNKKQIEAEFEYCDFIILTDCVTWMFLKKDEPVKDEKVVCLIQEGKWLQMEQMDFNNERMGNIHMKEPEQWDDLVNTIRTFVAEAKKQRKE